VHDCWLEPGQLLRDAGRLKGIPGTIVHGRYDMPCPAHYAWSLHKAWPEADFHLIEGAGHAWSEPGILDRLIRATDLYAGKAG
jgi:proline iminopeptidase